jgi:PepSY-associated TM region
MADTRAAKLRRLWLNVRLWIGVGLAVMLIPISISGALLVWHDDIDTWINPHRYAVTGARAALEAFHALHFQFAPSARLLDFDSAGSGFADGHLSLVPANRPRHDDIDNHDESASVARWPTRSTCELDRRPRAGSCAQGCTRRHACRAVPAAAATRRSCSQLARANGRARRSTKRNGRRPQRPVNRHPPAAG